MTAILDHIWRKLRKSTQSHPDDSWDTADIHDNSDKNHIVDEAQKPIIHSTDQTPNQQQVHEQELAVSGELSSADDVGYQIPKAANLNPELHIVPSEFSHADFGTPYIIGSTEEELGGQEDISGVDLPDPGSKQLIETPFTVEDQNFRSSCLIQILEETIWENSKGPVNISQRNLRKESQLLHDIWHYIENPNTYCRLLFLAENGFTISQIHKAIQLRNAWKNNPDLWVYRRTKHRRHDTILRWKSSNLTWIDAALMSDSNDSIELEETLLDDWIQTWKQTRFMDLSMDYIKYNPRQQYTSFAKYAVERSFKPGELAYDGIYIEMCLDESESFKRFLKKLEDQGNLYASKILTVNQAPKQQPEAEQGPRYNSNDSSLYNRVVKSQECDSVNQVTSKNTLEKRAMASYGIGEERKRMASLVESLNKYTEKV